MPVRITPSTSRICAAVLRRLDAEAGTDLSFVLRLQANAAEGCFWTRFRQVASVGSSDAWQHSPKYCLKRARH